MRTDEETEAAPGGVGARRLWAYGAAFVLLLVAALLLYRGNLDSSLKLVWTSMAVALVALLLALGAVLAPRR